MARHLIIGNNAAATGVASEVNLAVNVQKLSAKGPVALAAGESVADSDSIRLVQGTGGVNYYSPWIKGRNVVSFSGKSAAAQTAEIAVATFVGSNGAAIANYTLKIINLTNGNSPFEFKSYEVSIAASANVTAIADAFTAAINANPAHWLRVSSDPASNSSGVLSVVGLKKGEATLAGGVQEELVHMDFAFEAAATTMAVTYSTPGNLGQGDGFYVREMEEVAQGVGFGFYDRRNLPIKPALTSVTATAYDMYSIVATKDGSTTSSINGVDNLIEIVIAFDPATAALSSALEGKLNPYLNSVGFGSVNL